MKNTVSGLQIFASPFSFAHQWRRISASVRLLAVLATGTLVIISSSPAGTIIVTPAGLTDGDQYRLVFVTVDTYAGEDANIADYNTGVTNEANSVAALAALNTSWFAIGSTSQVNAIDNIGQDAGVRIFDFAGLEVAADATTSGLFSDTLLNPIDINENGGVDSGVNSIEVFTGSISNGTVDLNTTGLGRYGPETGCSNSTNSGWIACDSEDANAPEALYAISGVLTYETATPEPSTTGIFAIGGTFLFLVARWKQKIRNGRGGNS